MGFLCAVQDHLKNPETLKGQVVGEMKDDGREVRFDPCPADILPA